MENSQNNYCHKEDVSHVKTVYRGSMSKVKNILVLTSIYPADDIPKGWTPVVHYFTKEWVKQGHRVLVVNYQARFPKLYYMVAGLFQRKISSKVGYTVMTSAVDD